MTESKHGLQQWLSKGYEGEMDYMARHGSRRARPDELVPGTIRVISLRMNYMPAAADSWKVILNGNKAFISHYALGRDYHKVLRTRLQKLAERISAKVEHFNYRVFTDRARSWRWSGRRKPAWAWRGKLLYFCRGMPVWLRNLSVELGNAPASAAVVEALDERRDHGSALVREHVQWALQSDDKSHV